MSDPDQHRIAGPHLSAAIKADGAELCSLRDAAGREWLWQAGPVWPRHAPVLFPIVGRLNGDRLTHEGTDHRLTQHGFARDRRFRWESREAGSCRLVLEDDEWTRASYPFPFRFALTYAVDGDALRITYDIRNPGDRVLPVSAGAHPAFRWPLAEGVAREAHSLTFDRPEPAPIRRLRDGLLRPEPEPTPIRDRVLALHDGLFADDAIILDQPASSSVRFAAPGTPGIEVSWDGFAQIGLWTRAGGNFLCIEPWHGTADPVGRTGEFAGKPGLMHVPPGGSRTLSLRIRVG